MNKNLSDISMSLEREFLKNMEISVTEGGSEANYNYQPTLDPVILTAQNQSYFRVQLNFDAESEAKVGLKAKTPTVLEVSFSDTRIFKSTDDDYLIKASFSQELQPLVNAGDEAMAGAVGDAVVMGMGVIAITTIAMNLLIGGSIKLLAAFLEHAQILSMLPCLSLQFPNFLGSFFFKLRKINLVLVESKEETKWYESVFTSSSLDQKAVGYSTIGFPT